MTAVAVDLEFDKDVILCAATCWTNGSMLMPQAWCSQDATGFIPLNETTLKLLVDTLWNFHSLGVTLVTWGGTGCDWPRLASAVPDAADRVRTMALASVDIPLVSAAANGMMMGLTATAQGMGFGIRPFCDSEFVPQMWNSKDAFKQHEVVQHVEWDACVTAQIWNRLMFQIAYARPQITWMTLRNGARSVRLQREKDSAGQYVLPSVESIMKWDLPLTKFHIPEHLHPHRLTAWLRT